MPTTIHPPSELALNCKHHQPSPSSNHSNSDSDSDSSTSKIINTKYSGSRLRQCLGLRRRKRPHPTASTSSEESEANLPTSAAAFEQRRQQDPTSPLVCSLSDTELTSAAVDDLALPRRRRSVDSAESPRSLKSSVSTSRKGVTYSRDGSIMCCRFCEILESRAEEFVYEDDAIVVFRPLNPVVKSHILVVPRCHIRNVNKLTRNDSELLKRMRKVAAIVLGAPQQEEVSGAQSPSSKTSGNGSSGEEDADYKYAFHTPPFNSIDHVHMHAFQKSNGSFGCLGSIKYRTETWWCRSFDEVMVRLGLDEGHHANKRRQSQVRQDGNEAFSPTIIA